MKVRDCMEVQALATAREDDDLSIAAQIMAWRGVRHLPVLRDGVVVGVLTERDVVTRPADARVGEVMSRPAATIGPDEDLDLAARLMVSRRVGCLPVVERGRLIGMLTRTDVLLARAAGERRPPGGHVLVRHAMTSDPAVARPDDLLFDAVARMQARGVRHLPVVDGDRRPIGMLSDRDVRTAIGNPMRTAEPDDARVRLEHLRVAHVMTPRAITIRGDAAVEEAAARFIDLRVGALPVVDGDERLIGVLSYVDVLRVLGQRAAHAAEASP